MSEDREVWLPIEVPQSVALGERCRLRCRRMGKKRRFSTAKCTVIR